MRCRYVITNLASPHAAENESELAHSLITSAQSQTQHLGTIILLFTLKANFKIGDTEWPSEPTRQTS
jgi:hypothetical protein